ncbi:Detected protein of unknown function [Hibiscus syriacus]|uniref:EGF-like domain-containing protein n=1 Tax=Hibiscus syriacus TaxID=106335 RepID=A0A6A2YNS3_HIBSY|nr:Detected protein of unknown function [Hibiscus syriacus]
MKLYTCIYVLVLLSWLSSSEADSASFNVNLLPVNGCAIVNCVQGSCRETDDSILGFECDCYPGWTKYRLGPIVFPPCIIPNCTLNLGCGNGSPSPPAAPPATFNLSDPCTLTWCGDGSCKTNESGYECNCNDGSDNLLDMPALPCFNECALGVGCHGITLGKPPPTPSNAPPPATSSSHGWASRIKDSLKILVILVAVFHQCL